MEQQDDLKALCAEQHTITEYPPLEQHPNEPYLTPADRQMWETWVKTCRLRTRTRTYRKNVEDARRSVDRMHTTHPDAYLSWSAGKDSTALAILLHECGLTPGLIAMSLKDDLDFPREEPYMRALAERLGIDLHILRPEGSMLAWLASEKRSVTDDLHTRASEYAQRVFWEPLSRWEEEHGWRGCYFGLRAQESAGRERNAKFNGVKYTKKDGMTMCQPIAFWDVQDVYGYMLEHNVEPFEIYRCCRLKKSPGWIRLDGILPGIHNAEGASHWLRTHYPHLFDRLTIYFPDLRRYS